MERFPKNVIFSGAVLMGITVAMGWGGLNIIIKGEIAKQMRLINGTDTYKAWQKTTFPLAISIYLFNLTNPNEVVGGAKPVLKELGPYVYEEKLLRDADEDNVINETLRYRQIRTYFFKPDLSTGNEDDVVVLLNEPMMAVAKLLKEMGGDVSKQAESWLMEKGEKVTMARTVREWLFGEFSVQHYIELTNSSFVTSAGDLKLNDEFEDGMFAAIDMMRKNNSDGSDGEWLIMTGRNHSSHFGKVVGWNGYDVLPFYKADTCNAVNGTDGTMFPPFVRADEPMYIFSPEMCRSVPYVRGDMMQIASVEAYRYHVDPNALMGAEKNPDNWCFCTSEDSSKCKNGIHQLDQCLNGFPRSVSHPHFLGADEELMKAVDGMMPDKEKHESFFDLHPMSGIVLKSCKRLQINSEVMPYPNFPSMASLPKVSLPILWIDETMDAHHSDILMLTIIKAIQDTWDQMRWGLLGLSGALIFSGIATALFRRSSIKSERVTLIQ